MSQVVLTGDTEHAGVRPARWQVIVFGGLQVRRDDTPVDVGSVRRRILLTELAVLQSRTVSADQLIELMWGHRAPVTALNQLHRAVGQLRHRLQPELGRREVGSAVERSGAGYRLGDAVETDVSSLGRGVEAASALARRSSRLNAAAVEELASEWTDLVALCTGEPFADLPAQVRQRPEFVAVSKRRTAVAALALRYGISHGAGDTLLDACEFIASSAPLDEPLQAALIEALLVAGHRARATMIFEQLRRRLHDELGIAPSSAVRAAYSVVHRRVQVREHASAFAEHPERASAVTHRFPYRQHVLDLPGFDPQRRPSQPAEALALRDERFG